jgi:hypothetical protein
LENKTKPLNYMNPKSEPDNINTSVSDPESGDLLTPGSGIGDVKKIRIRDKHPGSHFRELRNNFLG